MNAIAHHSCRDLGATLRAGHSDANHCAVGVFAPLFELVLPLIVFTFAPLFVLASSLSAGLTPLIAGLSTLVVLGSGLSAGLTPLV